MAKLRRLSAAAIVACMVLLAVAPAASVPAGGPPQVRARVVGTVWMRTAPAAPPGTFRIFLSDGTHVTGSCSETYRLDRWRAVSPGRLTVTEDGVAIPLDVSFAAPRFGLQASL
jgi:hypothetical protein